MFKSIVKWFLPGPKKIADMAAEKIQYTVNSSEKEDLISRYAGVADKAVEVQGYITGLLLDGRIDDLEKADISEKLRPLVDRLMELI